MSANHFFQEGRAKIFFKLAPPQIEGGARGWLRKAKTGAVGHAFKINRGRGVRDLEEPTLTLT